MKRRLTLAIAILVCLVSLPYAPRVQAQAANDAVRIERLAALGRLWGAIKFFHPYLAYKDIDWDKALVETIPKVNEAKSADEYRAAVAHMLSFLNDPNTRVLGQPAAPVAKASGGPVADQPYLLRKTEDNIAVIAATNYDQYVELDPKKAEASRKLFGEAAEAKAVVFDLRRPSGESSGGFSRNFSLNLPLLLDEDLTLPSMRHRRYSGWPYENDYRARSTYYSGFVTADAGVLMARGVKGSRRPMIFLINAGARGIHSLLAGLQAAGKAIVVQEGDLGIESGVGEYEMKLTDGVTVVMRTSELLNPNGTLGFRPDVIAPVSPASSPDSSPGMAAALKAARGEITKAPKTLDVAPPAAWTRGDKPYSEPAYPSAPYRLLALFKFWNVINYFFPYKHLIDRPWDSMLAEYIPKLEAAGDDLEYAKTVAEMVANIHDTHGYVDSPTLRQYFGTHEPPIKVKLIQGQTVTTHIADDSIRQKYGLSVGDVVISVDGEDIARRRERLGRLFAVSTAAGLEWRLYLALLNGPEKSQMKLVARNREGKLIEATMERTVRLTEFFIGRKYPVFTVLPEGFGYMDLARLTVPEVDAAFEAIKNTPAVIFDMRGYPKPVHSPVASRLTNKEVAVALFEQNMPDSPDPTYSTRLHFRQTVAPAEGKWRYAGKVVVLINEEAISASEHLCLYLEAAANVTFIGSPTNGANGFVTQMDLPGGISVNFSGQDVRHADGRQLQRIGIQPHIKVEPTIEGIRNGRDEVLEKAIEFLKKAGQ
ncbi:MAG: S41 family peptidase [Burkholderiales bacterium]